RRRGRATGGRGRGAWTRIGDGGVRRRARSRGVGRAFDRTLRAGGGAARAVVGAYDGRDGTLVGWACASSDGATVATIDRVCVRRDRRRRGVGTALVVLLGKVLFEREIYDVCAATPRTLGETLFSDAGFEDDASVYMRYRGEMLDE
ncbi:hypothetical protein BE221DRAFT_171110, partial [Ostreococcus tauri]